MRFNIKLDLNALRQFSTDSPLLIAFDEIENLEYWHDSEEDVTRLELEVGNNYLLLYVFLNDEHMPTYNYDESDITSASTNNVYITFSCEIDENSYQNLYLLEKNEIITILPHDKTLLYLYRLNDKNIKLNKTLTFISYMAGDFKAPLGVKNIELDVTGYDISNIYNYVYIPKLNRYYYITNIQLINKSFTRLILQEDVLMSWKELIKMQEGFITRWINSPVKDKIVDPRRPLESMLTVEYITPTPTEISTSVVNATLKTNFNANEDNFFVSVMAENLFTKTSVTPPDSNLPTISEIQSACQNTFFLRKSRIETLMKALISESNMVTYVNSILFLPFDPSNCFEFVEHDQTFFIGLPTSKVLCDDNKFHPLSSIPSGVTRVPVRRSDLGTSPYIVISDFTFTVDNDYLHREPYSTYEIYIAFVGWIKVDIESIANKRLIIYYTVDFQTGNGNVFLYNKTDGKMIYSSGCQLGVKLDLLSSNALELSRERQATQLNTIMGLLTSALSIGVGVVSENPVAVVGGVLSAGKTIASAVNSELMRYEKGQVTYGSGDSGTHGNLQTIIRRSYHKPLNISLNTYGRTEGYPYNYYRGLSELSGYAEIGDINFDSYDRNIYNDEVIEIIALLKNGVIF